MPVFFRQPASGPITDAITIRLFRLPEGIACIVSWPTPEPGLKTFPPSAQKPEAVTEALPYAAFLSEHHGGLPLMVELDDDIEWREEWGQLEDPPAL